MNLLPVCFPLSGIFLHFIFCYIFCVPHWYKLLLAIYQFEISYKMNCSYRKEGREQGREGGAGGRMDRRRKGELKKNLGKLTKYCFKTQLWVRGG